MNGVDIAESEVDMKKLAYFAIMAFGLVSLFGDIIYEGARGIVPPYLEFLGATALIVGLAGGLGEFLGYSLRLVSGYLADTTRAYWTFYLLGYILLISIPLLAFAGYWQIAVALVLVERIAKAIRSPARDTLFSVVSKGIGTGKAFGLHELMDQIGGMSGPAIVAIVLYLTNSNYFYAFSILLIPYFVMFFLLIAVYRKIKGHTDRLLPKAGYQRKDEKLTLAFKLYTIAVVLNTAGLIHVSLILYTASLTMAAWFVSVMYLVLQGVDAVVAPLAGHLYDKYGKTVLLIPFALSVIPSILTFMGTFTTILIAILFFGVILGMQESIYRAAISDMAAITKRGFAYGIFNSAYGGGFLLSGLIFGYFLDYNLFTLAIFYAIVTQIIAIGLLIKIKPMT